MNNAKTFTFVHPAEEDRPVVLILVVICTQLGAVDLAVGQKMLIYREQQIQLYQILLVCEPRSSVTFIFSVDTQVVIQS